MTITHEKHWPDSAAIPKDGEYAGSCNHGPKWDIYLHNERIWVVFGDALLFGEWNESVLIGLHLAAKRGRKITEGEMQKCVEAYWAHNGNITGSIEAVLATLNITVRRSQTPGETLLAKIKGMADADAARVLDEAIGGGK